MNEDNKKHEKKSKRYTKMQINDIVFRLDDYVLIKTEQHKFRAVGQITQIIP